MPIKTWNFVFFTKDIFTLLCYVYFYDWLASLVIFGSANNNGYQKNYCYSLDYAIQKH